MPINPADLFQEGWKIYRLIVEYDYLWHSIAAKSLERLMATRFATQETVRFLDLACGDAETTAHVLAQVGRDAPRSRRPVIRYLGIDNSPMALKEAAKTRFDEATEAHFSEADFVEFLQTDRNLFDIIYVGMSAHHLGLPLLPGFFAAVHARLAPGGVFVAWELFCQPDETRAEYLDRLHQIIRKFWILMPEESRESVVAHTVACDYPVTHDQWNAAATQAGLKPGRFDARSPDLLFAMVAHEA